MKRLLALFLTLSALCCTACAATNEDYYQQAQRFLGAGDYESAAQLFDQLGGYRDSTEYALYAAGLHALQNGDRELCRRSLMQVDPFLNSSRYLTWLQAEDLSAADDLEAAAALYQSLGAFYDSPQRVAELQAQIPARDIRRAQVLMNAGGFQQGLTLLQPYAGMEEADKLILRCEEGLQQQAYDQASALYDEGLYEEAMAAFEALGDTLDAQARLLSCRSALYTQAESDYATVTLSTCEELMARYAALGSYLNSADRLQELQQRFAVNLLVRDRAALMPWVEYGSYPVQESGASEPLRWQVIDVVADDAVLLCESVIDAMPMASVTDLTIGGGASPVLPDAEMLSGLKDLSCAATPYALAQGVEHHSDGRAWWWLADEAASGRHAIVWYSGAVLTQGVDDREPTVGVRPVIYVDLNHYAFTGGSGAKADPFR